MVTVYAVSLAVGVVALVILILGTSFATNIGRRGLNRRIGLKGRMILAALLGFGMGGMAAEFSPLGMGWQLCLLLAVVAAVVSVIWVRYASNDSTT